MIVPEPVQYIFMAMICILLFMLLMVLIVMVAGVLLSLIREFKKAYLTKEKHDSWFGDD